MSLIISLLILQQQEAERNHGHVEVLTGQLSGEDTRIMQLSLKIPQHIALLPTLVPPLLCLTGGMLTTISIGKAQAMERYLIQPCFKKTQTIPSGCSTQWWF